MSNYVDISSHQGTPDLDAYWAAGHRDLMLKATEGTGYAWPRMQALAREWHAKGGRCGYYHWLYGNVSAAAQAGFFWDHIEPVFHRDPRLDDHGRELGDWMMTDFEDVAPSRWVSDAQHAANVREFDQLCEQHGHVDDYAPSWYIAQLPQCIAYFKTRPVVASDYSHTPARNPLGLPLVAHQFTDRARVAGFAAGVDYNTWLTTAAPTKAPITPSVPAEELDMLIIYPTGNPGLPATFDGSKATRVQDGATVTALRAAGVKTVPVSRRDFNSFIAAGNR